MMSSPPIRALPPRIPSFFCVFATLLLLSSAAFAEDAQPANAQPANARQVEAIKKGDLVVTVENLEGTDGHLIVWLFDSEEHFPLGGEDAYRTHTVAVTRATLQVVFKDVPFYTYALVLLHDADDDGSMNFSITGPEEGHGVSRDASTLIGPSPYDEVFFRVDVARYETTVHMKY